MVSKFVPMGDLTWRAARERARGKRIVLVVGPYDLLHAGHVRHLAAAKRFGDILVVALYDDPSVQAVYGRGRPVYREPERVSMVEALEMVDIVTVFSGNDPQPAIRAVRPDVYVCGADETPGEVSCLFTVLEYGGRVESVPARPGWTPDSVIDEVVRRFGGRGR